MTTQIEGSYNFRRISDRLTSSGVVGEERLAALAEQGFTAVINLLPDSSQQAVPSEAELVGAQGLSYIHIPVDFVRPSVEDYRAFCSHMDRLSQAKLHMHCAANYRVSAFYACYAQQHGFWDADQAMSFVHDVWQPADYPGWPEWFEAVGFRGAR